MRHVVACATDAGGVRNVAALLPELTRRKMSPVVVTERHLLGLLGASSDTVVLADELGPGGLARLLADTRPMAVVCGTTRYSSPDRLIVLAAREAGVRNVAVLDEWYGYRWRFEDPSTGELTYLPDAIAVQDEQARREAASEGVPPGICYVTGSPALSALTRMGKALVRSPPAPLGVVAGVGDHPVFTFLSETHAADYGSGPGSRGPLGPFIGYTETSVREAIIEVLKRLKQRVILVEKLHPAADGYAANEALPPNVDWRTVRDADLWALLWHSDLVIGMRSMALLEAHVLGREAVSYQPGLIGADRCAAVRLGLIPRLERVDDLEQWCTRTLARARQAPARRVIREYPFAAPEVPERVVDLALGFPETK